MKAIGRSSLSSVLKVTLDVCWYLVYVAIAAMVGMAVYSLATGGNLYGHLNLPVAMEVHKDVYSITSENMGIGEAELDCAIAHMTFQSPGSEFFLFFLAFSGIGVAILLLVLYQLRRIFATLAAGSPFVGANAARIRFIGWVVIIGELVEQTLYSVGQFMVMAHFETEGITFRWDLDFSFSTILWGCVLLVLAEVFRLGVKMREEQELTV